jgi:hypothetical protein
VAFKADLINILWELIVEYKKISIIQLEIATGINRNKINVIARDFEKLHLVQLEDQKIEFESRTKKAKIGKVSVFELGSEDKIITLSSTIKEDDYIKAIGYGLAPENLSMFNIDKDKAINTVSNETFFAKLDNEEQAKRNKYIKMIKARVQKQFKEEEWYKLEHDLYKSFNNHKQKFICTKQDLYAIYDIYESIKQMNAERLRNLCDKEIANIVWK